MTSTPENTTEAPMSNQSQKPSRSGISGLVFVGCLLIAIALGLAFGNMAAAILGGLGVGFIAMAIARYATGSW